MNRRMKSIGVFAVVLCAFALSGIFGFAQETEQPAKETKSEPEKAQTPVAGQPGLQLGMNNPGGMAFGLPQGSFMFGPIGGMSPAGSVPGNIPGAQNGSGMQPAGAQPSPGGMQPVGIFWFQPGGNGQPNGGFGTQPGQPGGPQRRPEQHGDGSWWNNLWNGFWGTPPPANPAAVQPGVPGMQPANGAFLFGIPQNGPGSQPGMTMYGYGIPFGFYGYGMNPGQQPMKFDRPAEQPKTSFMENLPENERNRLADLYKKDRDTFRKEIQKLLDTKHEDKYQQVMDLREKYFAEKDDSKKEEIKKQLKELISQNYDIYQKSAERQIAETEYEIFMAQQRLAILKKAQSDRTQYAEILVKNTVDEYLDPEKIPSEDAVRKQFDRPWGAEQIPSEQENRPRGDRANGNRPNGDRVNGDRFNGDKRGGMNGARPTQGQQSVPGSVRPPQQGGVPRGVQGGNPAARGGEPRNPQGGNPAAKSDAPQQR